MAQQQKRILQPAGNNQVYDYYDAFRQTGYKQFYLHQGNSGALMWVDTVQSSEQTFVSGGISVAGGGAWAGKEALSAALTFNVPVNIKGDFFMNFYGFSDAQNGRCFSGAIFKFDGTTETQIGITQAGKPLGTAVYSMAMFLKINVPNVVHFKPNDQLIVREYVQVRGDGSAGDGSYKIYLESAQPYSNRILIPLKIDI